MLREYLIRHSEDNLRLTINMPENMLMDLMQRAKENGRDVHIEIMMRLARSLERDIEMDEQDEMMRSIMNQEGK